MSSGDSGSENHNLCESRPSSEGTSWMAPSVEVVKFGTRK